MPRYTSFPTAVHFNHDIPQGYYAYLLSSLNPAESISLYIHIPFCRYLCHYCGCHTRAVSTDQPVQAYLLYLHREIAKVGETLSCRPHVSHIHFGGGTPNIIGARDLKILIEKLGVYFEIDKNTEIDIEIDPRLLNPETINDLSIIGITRVSLGMQDFNPDVQKAVNRIQPFEKAQEDVLALRESGVRNINFDMMIGLPLQTCENIQLNAERAISLSPDRLAVFAYAHIPWMKKHQKLLEKYPIPGTRERYDMNFVMADTLVTAGYEAIGIDHFAHKNDPLCIAKKAGALHRNFQGYTCNQAETIIGFGMSSISSFKSAFVQNTMDPKEYREALLDNIFPIKRGRVLTDDDIQRSSIVEQIMCYFETKLEDVENPNYNLAQLDELKTDEIIRFDGDRLIVTEEGKSFTRVVASCFDPYYKLEEERHARAV
ncbi:MAG: oxygen-independent coproporphyrinogen III oxidase [Micavibrio sp.]|nr:oxygen-independent coproporphyrinogen III oxidase [Micavibrio sp.]